MIKEGMPLGEGCKYGTCANCPACQLEHDAGNLQRRAAHRLGLELLDELAEFGLLRLDRFDGDGHGGAAFAEGVKDQAIKGIKRTATAAPSALLWLSSW